MTESTRQLIEEAQRAAAGGGNCKELRSLVRRLAEALEGEAWRADHHDRLGDKMLAALMAWNGLTPRRPECGISATDFSAATVELHDLRPGRP